MGIEWERKMLERILVPLDGSTLAEKILGVLEPVLTRRDACVQLVRAIEPPATMNPSLYARLLEERRIEARAYLEERVSGLKTAGVRAGGSVFEGYPPEVILHAVETQEATLVAMTTHGRTGLARWQLGSVAEKVIRASKVPVLVGRSFTADPDGSRSESHPQEFRIRRVVLPIDPGDSSRAAVEPALEVARLFEAEVILVGVLQTTAPDSTLPPAFEEIRQAIADRGMHAEIALKAGDPAGEILAVARESQAGMIVMASRGRRGLPRWLLGSVAERIVRTAHVPVLVVPPPT